MRLGEPRGRRTARPSGDGRARLVGAAFMRDRRGGVLAWLAFTLAAIIACAVAAVDMGMLYVLRNQHQATADAAALAGVSQLPGDEVGEFVGNQTVSVAVVTAEALAYAEKNMAPATFGTVLCTAGVAVGDCLDAESDVVLGHWQGGNVREFTCYTPQRGNPNCPQPATSTTNAVQAITRQAGENANPATAWFFRYFGQDTMEVGAMAIAEGAGVGDCIENGIVAKGKVYMGSTINADESCIYGQEGVKVGSQNSFYDAMIGMPDLAMLEEGSDNAALTEALQKVNFGEDDNTPTPLADMAVTSEGTTEMMYNTLNPPQIPETVDEYSGGDLDFPSDLTLAEGKVIENAVITATGKVSIGSDYILKNVVILADGDVQVGSDFVFTNVIIISRNRVQLGSYGKMCIVGGDGKCTEDSCAKAATVIVAGENFLLGSNSEMHGTQIVAGQLADIGSDFHRITGSPIQSGGDIKLGSQLQVSDCNQTPPNKLSNGRKIALVR